MENQETQFSEQESLQLIHKMITAAQGNIRDNSWHFLLWGWLTFISALIFYVLLYVLNYGQLSGLIWIIMPFVGFTITWVHNLKMKTPKRIKTYVDDVMKYFGIAFGVSMFIVLFFSYKLQDNTYPILMILYGICLFVWGGTLKSKPLIIGGIINWIIAIQSFFVIFQYQVLLIALAVLLGYIIPGYILKANYKNENI